MKLFPAIVFLLAHSALFAVPLLQSQFPGSAATGTSYGYAVATDGPTLVISSANHIDFWNNDGHPWTLVSRLPVSAFISSITIYKTSALAKHPGGAYAFELAGGRWTQTQSLTLPDGSGYNYSHGIALLGNLAVVGGPNYGAGVGRFYVLKRASPGNPWTLSQIVPSVTSKPDYFGGSVNLAVSGTTTYLLAGANVTNSYTGAVYAYWYNPATQTFAYSGGVPSIYTGVSRFGEVISGDSNLIAISAPASLNFQGSVAMYRFSFTSSGVMTATNVQLVTSSALNSTLFGINIKLTSSELVVATRASLTWHPVSGGAVGAPTALPVGTPSTSFGTGVDAANGAVFAGDPGSGYGMVLYYR